MVRNQDLCGLRIWHAHVIFSNFLLQITSHVFSYRSRHAFETKFGYSLFFLHLNPIIFFKFMDVHCYFFIRYSALTFAFLQLEYYLDWYRHLLEASMDFTVTLDSINNRNCIGSVLAINGYRKYYYIYHPKRARRSDFIFIFILGGVVAQWLDGATSAWKVWGSNLALGARSFWPWSMSG